MKHIAINLAAILVLCLLFACASSTGVYQVSDNTYRVATRATWELGGRAGAVKMALEEATDYCAKRESTLKVLDSVEHYGHFEGGTVDMKFTCESQLKKIAGRLGKMPPLAQQNSKHVGL